LHIKSFDAYFLKTRRELGPPWNQDHKLALAAGITAALSTTEGREFGQTSLRVYAGN